MGERSRVAGPSFFGPSRAIGPRHFLWVVYFGLGFSLGLGLGLVFGIWLGLV